VHDLRATATKGIAMSDDIVDVLASTSEAKIRLKKAEFLRYPAC